MSLPHILMIGAYDDYMGAFGSLGIRLTLFQKEDSLTPLQTATAEKVFTLNYENVEECLRFAIARHETAPFDGVVSFTEYGLEAAARIQNVLRVRGNPMAPVKATRDKTEMRRLISHLDVGRAEFMLCSHFEDLAAFWHKLNGPLILKPAKGSGSEGVSLIRRTEELAKAWVRSTAPKVMPLIAEEYFDGPEFSVESLTVDGTHEILAVTQKITTGELGFVETGHQMPAPISKAVFQQMATSVTQFLQAVGHAVGPAHTELRLTAKGPRIIESNTRPGGDFIWQMVELVCGVDLVAATLADLAHVPQPKRKPVAPAAAVRFFAYANGRVTHLDQTEKAAELPGIVRFHCSLAVGAELGPLRSSDDRQGFVVAIGESLAQAMERADNAIAAVRLELAPQTAQ